MLIGKVRAFLSLRHLSGSESTRQAGPLPIFKMKAKRNRIMFVSVLAITICNYSSFWNIFQSLRLYKFQKLQAKNTFDYVRLAGSVPLKYFKKYNCYLRLSYVYAPSLSPSCTLYNKRVFLEAVSYNGCMNFNVPTADAKRQVLSVMPKVQVLNVNKIQIKREQ